MNKVYTKPKRRSDFRRICKRRVEATLRMYRLLGNLSNQTLYLYTDQELDQVEEVLRSGLEEAIDLLRSRKVRSKDLFSLDQEK